MTSNTAAWITAAKAKPFEIKPYPLSTPGANQILIKNHALAVNPIDGKLQALAILPLKYPTILGEDVAGKVIAVGSDVTLFKTGDRVIGNAAGFGTKRDEDKGFQAYTILETNMACRIPDTISFEQAVVLPLAVSTASSGLFNPDFLNLQLPTEPAQSPTDKSLLVWGGASSVGSCAIQLAVAAGYEVVTTASPKNFEYVKKLGAQYVFDYNSTSVVSDIVTTLKGKVIAGAFDAVGGAAWAPTVAVVEQSEGVKFVATVTPGFPDPPDGISMRQVYSLSIMDNHVGKAVYEDFLPNALQAGSFIPAPEPLVAGRGLSSIQTAVNLQREGTSAQKVVVVLDT
ncbi:GroES-like protein [Glarea lozoyensis ATCC 20868]|uniref:GroES-like protein n=1 Tax=Glarea lozoyensis (strain ATCC 20868 / MF5171) TaxID=1116229 RepID=S3DR59_GLAL2|nr:GroES-like protein [Glarea lozoyensis ATCC 20868]EPE28953.1 GroES-like protein [Glarea lozoyensis ATCC 20868]